jgi:hypothetical protein
VADRFCAGGRFPDGRSELHDDAIAYVATQVKIPASDLGLFDWEGRTAERHRKQVRTFCGFHACTVPDAEKLTDWLAEHVCSRQRQLEHLQDRGAQADLDPGGRPAAARCSRST